jgi:hypothetical protein
VTAASINYLINMALLPLLFPLATAAPNKMKNLAIDYVKKAVIIPQSFACWPRSCHIHFSTVKAHRQHTSASSSLQAARFLAKQQQLSTRL